MEWLVSIVYSESYTRPVHALICSRRLCRLNATRPVVSTHFLHCEEDMIVISSHSQRRFAHQPIAPHPVCAKSFFVAFNA